VTNARRAVLVGVVLVVIAGVVALLTVDRSSQLDKAIARLGDADRFATSATAGQTVADISTDLRVDGTNCRTRDNGPQCGALLSAAAFTAVTAVTMLDCTAPDIFDARVSLERYLRKLRDFIDDGAQGAAPTLPKVITC
jgi:hypothetical protein